MRLVSFALFSNIFNMFEFDNLCMQLAIPVALSHAENCCTMYKQYATCHKSVTLTTKLAFRGY